MFTLAGVYSELGQAAEAQAETAEGRCQLAEYLRSVSKLRHRHIDAQQSLKKHRFPVEIISHAVWRYFRFCLSFRDVEELLLERGVVVTYEAIRQWCQKFGQ